MRLLRKAALSAACLVLPVVAAAVESPPFEPVAPLPGQATLYVYHGCSERGIVGSGANVSVDGSKGAYLYQGMYFGRTVAAGHHDVKWSGADVPTIKASLYMVDGQTYYLRVEFPKLISGSYEYGGTEQHVITLVDPQVGAEEILLCKKGKKRWLGQKTFDE